MSSGICTVFVLVGRNYTKGEIYRDGACNITKTFIKTVLPSISLSSSILFVYCPNPDLSRNKTSSTPPFAISLNSSSDAGDSLVSFLYLRESANSPGWEKSVSYENMKTSTAQAYHNGKIYIAFQYYNRFLCLSAGNFLELSIIQSDCTYIFWHWGVDVPFHICSNQALVGLIGVKWGMTSPCPTSLVPLIKVVLYCRQNTWNHPLYSWGVFFLRHFLIE